MYDDDKNKCPFYKRYTKYTIVCEGVNGSCNTELAFKSNSLKKKEKYIEQHCRTDYKSCMVCQMLMSKYE